MSEQKPAAQLPPRLQEYLTRSQKRRRQRQKQKQRPGHDVRDQRINTQLHDQLQALMARQ
jgi:hypothetical protein